VGAPWGGEPAAAEQPFPAVHERPWAVGAYLGFTAAVGLAWSVPLAAALGAVTGAYPRGDAELFDPGAVMLAEAARRVIASLSVLRAAWVVVAVLALPIGFVVLAFALAQLASRRLSFPRLALARAVRAVPALLVIGLVALLAGAVVVALFMIGGGELVRSIWPAPPHRDLARFGLFGAVALAVLAVGVLHDLARAAAVSGPSRAYGSMRAALRTVARSPGSTAWAYAWRASAGVAALGVAAWLGVLVGQRTSGALVVSALVHQLGLAVAGWLRLSWLARAVRLVEPALPRRAPHADPASGRRPAAAPAPGDPS
jgi:hypothetical protein